MSIEKIKNSIPVSNFTKIASSKTSKWGSSINNFLTKHPKADKFVKMIEPTNHDNAFLPLMGLMVGFVIIPRIATASKRNPDDKQATKDEISEILFRDVQTVAIILFLLKALNAIVANAATKKTGLPMVNQTFEQFKKLTNIEGSIFKKIKGNFLTICENTKIFGKNVLSALNPLGGSRALTNAELVSKYSNYGDVNGLKKMFDDIQAKGGDKNKIFNTVIDSLISNSKANNVNSKMLGKKADDSFINLLLNAKEKGVDEIDKFDDRVKEALCAFFSQTNKGKVSNPVLQKAINVNGWMNGGCLLIESAYLGAGLPALNQRRLEKKYLKNGKNKDSIEFSGKVNESVKSSKNIAAKNVKPQEIQLYKSFIKG